MNTRSPNGQRYIDGMFFLLCGRWFGFDAKERAQREAEQLKRSWEFVKVVRVGFHDYACYVFCSK